MAIYQRAVAVLLLCYLAIGSVWADYAGVAVRTTDAYKIHHDKILIADGNTVETGSFNYTKAAEESNSENAVVLQDMPGVADIYLKHWASRWETGKDWHSTY
ncbi:phospholipase D-like domain-containing protein [Rouxiella badensis]|uniref:phospholipase D-like domain-containing protein n=1 Tax=Rouxiella badensis TaxID=1646377 RepID=UPI002AD5328E|nr:phospholipase D-like domain-containing protein [Rouxiella badensis]